MDKFKATSCEDCSYPPNHIIGAIPSKNANLPRFTIKCRDCGDSWEEDGLEEDF